MSARNAPSDDAPIHRVTDSRAQLAAAPSMSAQQRFQFRRRVSQVEEQCRPRWQAEEDHAARLIEAELRELPDQLRDRYHARHEARLTNTARLLQQVSADWRRRPVWQRALATITRRNPTTALTHALIELSRPEAAIATDEQLAALRAEESDAIRRRAERARAERTQRRTVEYPEVAALESDRHARELLFAEATQAHRPLADLPAPIWFLRPESFPTLSTVEKTRRRWVEGAGREAIAVMQAAEARLTPPFAPLSAPPTLAERQLAFRVAHQASAVDRVHEPTTIAAAAHDALRPD